ncbi:MAG: BREX-3 system phosphatase PglZ [Candidatus Promineifilaceae bacterium]
MSRSFQDVVLKQFVPEIARLTLVADPDDLLGDEGMQESLETRGFELVRFDDPVSFRYLYESAYRTRWAAGETFELVIVVQGDEAELEMLPYDLLRNGRRLSLNLATFFPNLSYRAVTTVAHRDLGTLYEAQRRYRPGKLGENGTKDFILRHVFSIAADLIKNETDLLVILMRLHLAGRELPEALSEHLGERLGGEAAFAEWPLEELLSDSAVLVEFLQERWPLYLDSELTSDDEKTLRESGAMDGGALKWPGPAYLPFGQAEIRAFVDTLFLEGKLQPIAVAATKKLRDSWARVGVRDETAEERVEHLVRLLDQLEAQIPPDSGNYRDWQRFMPAWAEAIVLRSRPETDLSKETEARFRSIQESIDTAFQGWLANRYHRLGTLSPHPPIMVDHIARSLTREVNRASHKKAALIVMDGMAYDQWLIISRALREQLPEVRMRESAVFAWIPTLTSVSRQAIFAGRAPLYFSESINTTSKEAALWSSFWENEGLSKAEIGYVKGLRSAADLARVKELLAAPKMLVVGLVVDQIDRIMHGIEMGLPGLQQHVDLWMKQGFMTELISLLLEHEFRIFVTSDHGNIAAEGIGSPREQALADLRGARARIYPNQTLRSIVQANFPDAIAWPDNGLPPDYYPLLAPKRNAFTQGGQTIVSHGGAAAEEVIVPYIEVERIKT